MARPFSLAAVLLLRQRREEAEERALASLAVKRQSLLASLERVQEAMRQGDAERQREVGRVDVAARQQAHTARLCALGNAKTTLETQLNMLEIERQAQQTVYLAARQGREALTEVRQQADAQQAAIEQRQEQMRLDDLATMRFGRRPGH